MSCNCGKPKCNGKCGISPAVLQINNPDECTLFHKVTVPASMGDSKTNPPKNGDYKNVLLYFEADQTSWLFSSDCIPTQLVNGMTNYEDAQNLPSINNHTLLGNMSGSDLDLQDKLTAGDNIQITGTTISATDTTYDDFVGATSDAAGEAGLVPAPASGATEKFLKSDGTWSDTTAFLPYPASVNKNGTTPEFIASIQALNAEVGTAYLGTVSLTDLPEGLVQEEVMAYVYDNNVVYLTLRSADTAPYIWNCNSYAYRGWEPIDTTAVTVLWANSTESGNTRHLYSDTGMYNVVSMDDVINAAHKGLLFVRLAHPLTPEQYNESVLVNVWVSPNDNDYQIIFTDGNYTYNYGADDPSDTTFSFSGSQYQRKLTAGAGIDITNNVISVKDPAPEDFFDGPATDSGCGLSVALNNIIDGQPASLSISGDTEQQTYSGKNLFGAPTLAKLKTLNTAGSWSGDVYTFHGLTFTPIVSNGMIDGIRVSGTASANIIFVADKITRAEFVGRTTAGSNYVLSGCPSGGSSSTYYLRMAENPYKSLYTDTGSSHSRALPEITSTATTVQLSIGIDNGTVMSGQVYKPMFELGSTATSFEPYVGGIPAPNPDYPQDVKTVTGKNVIGVYGKNLFDITKNSDSLHSAIETSGSIVSENTLRVTTLVAGAYRYYFIPLPDTNAVLGRTITLKANASINNATSGAIRFMWASDSWYTSGLGTMTTFSTGGAYTCTVNVPNEIPAGSTRLCVGFYSAATTSSPANSYIDFSNIQVEVGSQATAYEPYKGHRYTVDLGSIELCGLGDYQDYIWNDNGTWKKHKVISKHTLTGSEDWFMSSRTTASVFVAGVDILSLTIKQSTKDQSLMSHFRYLASTSMPVGTFDLYNGSDSVQYIALALDATSVPDVNAAKAWITANQPTIYYVLTEPTDETITSSALIAQLEAIALIDGSNIVAISGSSLDGDMCIGGYENNWNGNIDSLNSKTDLALDRLSTLQYNSDSAAILYAFFDDSTSNISFYSSKDGTSLQKILGTGSISGRDPSLFYENGKYYVAVTSYSSTHDFTIYESSDLKEWQKHDINVGLYSATYPKRWCPEWFKDTDGRIYIFLSKQYADTEGWGDFEVWMVECTDLENFVFGTPAKLTLSGATSNNHIDAWVTKYNGVYQMIVKDDTTTAHTLEHYTSSDMLNWTRVAVDPMNFGRGVEGQTGYKIGDYYYIGAERYINRPLTKSYYALAKTKDFVNYSSVGKIVYPDEDLSHGGSLAVPEKQFNKLLSSNGLTLETPNFDLSFYDDNKNFHIAATQLTVDDTNGGARIGRYLHLFDVKCELNYRVQSVKFRLSTNIEANLDCEYSLLVRHSNTDITSISLGETYCTYHTADRPRSVAGWLVAVKDNAEPKLCHVYLDLNCPIINNNSTLLMEITSLMTYGGTIVKYTDSFSDSIDLTSNVYKWANGSENSRTITINNVANTKCRIVMGAYPGAIKVSGHLNSVNDDGRFDGNILVNSNYFNYINLNPNLRQAGLDVTMTMESYDPTTSEYTFLIENLPPSCAMSLTIPPSNYSYFKSVSYLV